MAHARKRFYPTKNLLNHTEETQDFFKKNILLIYQMLFDGNPSDQPEVIAVLNAIISVWR